MEKEVIAANIESLERGTFIIMYEEDSPVDSGIILDVNRFEKVIEFLSNKQECTLSLIGDPESNIWHISHEDLDGRPCFSQRGSAYTIRENDRRIPLS